jgi:cysteate synthase
MPETFTKTSYKLRSVNTGKMFEDSGWVLDPPGEEKPSLIRAEYEKKQLTVGPEELGLYRFADWLPIRRILKGSAAPVTFKSEGLAKALGLTNLYITFSGWWPERGALMKSCSFKETEAYSVCGRMDGSDKMMLVVASAGNTARAFAKVCSENNIPLLVCMPEDTVNAMWFDAPINDCVRLIVTRPGSDYFDAIHLSALACQVEGFFPEGGAKNIARRDGMATTVLSAAAATGKIPDYYFQAVGSGTGAIAAWEANLRLIGDGRFGSNKMKLIVSQNCPFLPMFDAWKADSRELLPLDDHAARKQVIEINAKVLSNRRPPYPIAGGLYDALKDSGGDILKVTNREAHHGSDLFRKTEGVSIHPAAAVAVASLEQAVKAKSLPSDAFIMLNITGGGEEEFRKQRNMHYLQPAAVFDIDPPLEEVRAKLREFLQA